MRSLTVPVSFSSLLFPTVWPCLSFSLGSFPSFAFVGLGSAGAGVGCCGSCCYANAGATATSSPISSESAMLQAIPFCLLIAKSNYLLADGERAIGLVRHHAAHRTELRFALLVLSHANRCKKRENHCQTANASPHAHPLPPVAGCIRNTMLSSFTPAFASTVRVCSANPFAWITIS